MSSASSRPALRLADVSRDAIAHVRESEHAEDPDASARSAPTYRCGCQPPRRLRMAPTVYARADVLCAACGQPFTTD